MSTQKDSLKGEVSQGGLLLPPARLVNPRQLIAGISVQFKKLWRLLLLLYLPILLLFIVLRIISHYSDRITLSYLTRDVAAIANLPFYAGLMSQMGGLMWAASLAICIFASITLGRQNQSSKASRQLLLHASILTAVLLVDDMFQFHEEIGEDYLGISEKLSVLVLVSLGLFFLFANLREIFTSEYLILGLALSFLGLSVFLDAADLEEFGAIGRFFSNQLQTFAEDGLKFAGILTWLVYFARYSYQRIRVLNQSHQAN
jgi:hypothetical protein